METHVASYFLSSFSSFLETQSNKHSCICHDDMCTPVSILGIIKLAYKLFYVYFFNTLCALNKINITIPLGVKIISLLNLTFGFGFAFLIISIELLF